MNSDDDSTKSVIHTIELISESEDTVRRSQAVIEQTRQLIAKARSLLNEKYRSPWSIPYPTDPPDSQ